MLQWTLECVYLSELQFFLDICPGVGLLHHTVAPFLIKVCTLFFFDIMLLHTLDYSTVWTQVLYALGNFKIHVTHLFQYLLYCDGMELNLQYLCGMPAKRNKDMETIWQVLYVWTEKEDQTFILEFPVRTTEKLDDRKYMKTYLLRKMSIIY